MTGRRRLRVCVHGVVQGVGFRPFVYTTRGRAGPVRIACAMTAPAPSSKSRATPVDIDDFLARLRDRPPPLAVIESIEIQDHPGRRRHRLHHRGHVTIGRRPHPGLPRRRHVRRMRRRAARPGQPALPARVRQLHQLRPAVHHHRLAALRPRVDHHGPLRDVRRLCPRVRRPRRPAVPRPARVLPELRTDAALPRPRRPRRPSRESGLRQARRLLRDGGILAVKGIGGYHLACDAANEARGRRAAHAKAPRRQAVRRDGGRPDDCARHRRVDEASARLLSGPQRPIVLMPRLPDAPDRRCGGAAQPRPRRHAGLHAAARRCCSGCPATSPARLHW